MRRLHFGWALLASAMMGLSIGCGGTGPEVMPPPTEEELQEIAEYEESEEAEMNDPANR